MLLHLKYIQKQAKKLKRSISLDLCADYNLEELKLAILLKEQDRMIDGYTIKIVDEHDAQDCRLLALKADEKKLKKNHHTRSSQHQRKNKKLSSQKHEDDKRDSLIDNDNFSLSSNESDPSQDFDFSDSDNDANKIHSDKKDDKQKDNLENNGNNNYGEDNVVSEDSNKNQEEMINSNEEANMIKSDVVSGDEHILSSAFLCDEIKDNGRKFALFIPNEGVEDEHALMVPLPRMLRARDSIPLINKNLKVLGNTIYNVDKPIFIKYVERKNITSSNQNDIYGESDSDDSNNNDVNVQRRVHISSSDSILTEYSYSDGISEGIDG